MASTFTITTHPDEMRPQHWVGKVWVEVEDDGCVYQELVYTSRPFAETSDAVMSCSARIAEAMNKLFEDDPGDQE